MHLSYIPQQVNDIYNTINPSLMDMLEQKMHTSVLYLVCLNF